MFYSQARNAVVYSHAGRPQLRSEIGLYRVESGGQIRNLTPGSMVQLGEELVLRAHIKSGDGKLMIFECCYRFYAEMSKYSN